MDYNTLYNLEFCKEIVDELISFVLYSHVPPAAIAILVSGYILYKTRTLAGRVLFALASVFSIWSILDLSIWLNYAQSSSLMAAWSVLGLLSVIMFFLVFYFAYVIAFDRNMPLWIFGTWGILILPVLLLSPTNYNLTGYDVVDCVALENTLFTNYYYGIGALVFLTIPLIGSLAWRRSKDPNKNWTGVVMMLAGAELFLAAFFTTGIVAQYLVEQGFISDFGLEQYGIVAMAVFMVFLAYAIVQYQQFKIKLIATQALVVAIVVLIAAELAFVRDTTNLALVVVTLVFASVAGTLLTRSVKLEIQHREEIERLAQTLDETNGRQETLIHFIGHEVKGFLTKDAGAFASLVEGDFGELPESSKGFVANALAQSRAGADSVANILKASNLKKGTVTYAKVPFDLKTLVASAVEKVRASAEQKGLKIEFVCDEGLYQMLGDAPQLNDHVLRNLIENSINYTPTGTITVSLKNEKGKLHFAVKDTGVGITDEDKKRLFTEGGHGAESQKVNVHSTGYGLYIAKQITEAHGGTVRAESEGKGKGSTFIAEFPSTAQAGGAAPATTITV